MNSDYIKSIPVPACVVGPDGNVIMANSRMKKVIVFEDIIGANFFAMTGIRRETLLKANNERVYLERNDRTFKLRINDDASEEAILLFSSKRKRRETYKSRLESEHPAIVFINIDNYDELTASTADDSRRAIPTQVDSILQHWCDSFDSPVFSTGEDSYVIYTSKGKIDEMIEDNFSVLDEVRGIETQVDFPVSISIGVGLSDVSMAETTDLAEAALELALGRGGDQAVVKDDEHTDYYGGTLQAVEKNNRGKARVVAHALKQLIKSADRVIITGHRWPDMDAFGSAIAAYCICRYLDKDAYIVVDKHNEALDSIYDQAVETDEYQIIRREKALGLVTEHTLLIIVDVNRPMLLECPELVEACKTRVVIDHHRMTDDSLTNSNVSYIESYASSASELMAELLQHISPKRFINKFEAEAMLAGIMVDTNNFSGRTGVRTFEAASWLKRAGADTTEVKRYFQMDQTDFKSKASAIAHATFTDDGVAYAATRGHTANTQIINAQVADELLMVKGVKASFVIGANEKGQTIISARSLGKINVQPIMEKFGGGGHFTSAAAQIDEPADYVESQLRKYVKEYLENEN